MRYCDNTIVHNQSHQNRPFSLNKQVPLPSGLGFSGNLNTAAVVVSGNVTVNLVDKVRDIGISRREHPCGKMVI